MKLLIQQMLKVSAFYLEKQKSFIAKKNLIQAKRVPKDGALLSQFSGKVLDFPIPSSNALSSTCPHHTPASSTLVTCFLELVDPNKIVGASTLPVKMFGTFWSVWSKRVKQTQQKQACHSHDDAPPLSFQLQVTEAFF